MTTFSPELVAIHGSVEKAKRRRVEAMAASLILAKINPTKDEGLAVRDMLSRGWTITQVNEVLSDVKTEWTKRRQHLDGILIAQGRFKNKTLFER
jgi:hypothetical protein